MLYEIFTTSGNDLVFQILQHFAETTKKRYRLYMISLMYGRACIA